MDHRHLKKLQSNIISIHGLAGITGFLAKTKKKIELKKRRYHADNSVLEKKRQKKEEENNTRSHEDRS